MADNVLLVTVGADFSTVGTVVDTVTGAVTDITGATVEGIIYRADGTAAVTMTAALDNPSQGTFKLSLTAAETTNLPPGRWLVSAKIVLASGETVITPAVRAEVTDPFNIWGSGTGWSSGSWLVPFPLSALDDVTISNVQPGEVLGWSGTEWVNQPVATSGVFDVDLTVSKTSPAVHLVQSGDTATLELVNGVLYARGGTAAKVYFSGPSDGDVAEIKVRYGGTWEDMLHSGLIASQAEAQAGTDNTKVMTPLRTAEAIVALWGNRTISPNPPSGGSDGDVHFQV